MNESVVSSVDQPKPKRHKRDNGSGSICKKASGKYEARVMIGYNANGKPKFKSFTGKTEAEAKRRMKQYILENPIAAKDVAVTYSNYTVAMYMSRWLTTVKYYELKPKSYDRLEQVIEKEIYPNFGSLYVGAVTAALIQKHINAMTDAGKSLSSIKKVYDAFNACYKLGIARGELKINPCVGVRLPKRFIAPSKEVPYYTEEEARKIAETALMCSYKGVRDYRLGPVYILLMNTGLRLGEVVALEWDRDVDLEKRFIRVSSNMVTVTDRSEDPEHRYTVIKQDSAKTAAGTGRRVVLNNSAFEALLLLKEVTGDTPYVLSTRAGERVKIKEVDQTFRRILKRAGIPEEKHYGVHSLRHTCATLLLKNGVDIKVVSKILGHSDVTTTYNTYIHIMREQEEEALGTLPDLF